MENKMLALSICAICAFGSTLVLFGNKPEEVKLHPYQIAKLEAYKLENERIKLENEKQKLHLIEIGISEEFIDKFGNHYRKEK